MTQLSRLLTTGALAAVTFLCLTAIAQDSGFAGPAVSGMSLDIPSPPLLEVRLNGPADSERLRALDLDVILERRGTSARILGWPGTEDALRSAGFRPSVLFPDYGAALARMNGADLPVRSPRVDRLTSVPPQGEGSFAGYYSFEEIEQYLADLTAADPYGIVGSLVQIGTSRQGRPIHAVRISNETLPDHSRPRVLFTGLTHGREPLGMQSVIEFMTRLVEGYGVDPNLTYLVNRREIWFVPCVNPDGYMINQATWFASGSYGMWRKNARDNDGNGRLDNFDGVDLNRNYGYRWGIDNGGSSPNMTSDMYRGPFAFSEPETQAMRDFAIAHQFTTANNYHTFGEYCLYSWGYSGLETPDGAFFARMSQDMCRDVSYEYGVARELLYPVNGGAGDWFYGEQTAKPKCFAVTVEVGDDNDGFWPAAERVPVLAALQLRSNIVLAYAAGVFVMPEKATVVSGDGTLNPGGAADVALELRHAGLVATGSPVTASVVSLTPGITVPDPVSMFPAMNPGEIAGPSGGDFIGLEASASVAPGALVNLLVTLTTDGSYFYQDVVQIVAGVPVVAFSDDASAGTGQWIISSRWGIEPVGGNPAFSDSPGGLHTTSAVAILTKASPLDLSGAGRAYLEFRTWYDMEGGGDAGRVEISTDGGTSWTGIPGRYTRPGHGMTGAYALGTQALNEPCYDATRRFPVNERMDLSAYAGLTDVQLRFRFTADQTGRQDGWYVDDIAVLVYPSSTSGVPEPGAVAGRPALSPASPNPFRTGTRLTMTFPGPTVFSAGVYGVDGRLVRALADGIAAAGDRDLYWDGRTNDGRTAAAGTYFIRVASGGDAVTRRIIRLR